MGFNESIHMRQQRLCSSIASRGVHVHAWWRRTSIPQHAQNAYCSQVVAPFYTYTFYSAADRPLRPQLSHPSSQRRARSYYTDAVSHTVFLTIYLAYPLHTKHEYHSKIRPNFHCISAPCPSFLLVQCSST